MKKALIVAALLLAGCSSTDYLLDRAPFPHSQIVREYKLDELGAAVVRQDGYWTLAREKGAELVRHYPYLAEFEVLTKEYRAGDKIVEFKNVRPYLVKDGIVELTEIAFCVVRGRTIVKQVVIPAPKW